MTSTYTLMVMVQKTLNTYTLQEYLTRHKQLVVKMI
nr:MAG TPA: hypothetical protein [Bacteriophage sp.]DAU52545.1 MAG TPA: hypothetical protein [Crassvirales sp.]DAV76817.1 MAG TPA: hypothetical protein [Caudoviricetes sp.]